MKSRKIYVFIVFLIGIIIMIPIAIMAWHLMPHIDLDAVEESFQHETSVMYCYEHLDEDKQDTYKRLYYAITEFQEEVPLKEKDIEEVEDIYQAVMSDHPELYYVDGAFEYYENDDLIILSPNFIFQQEELEEYDRQLEETTQDIIERANKQEKTIDKMKILYDYIVESVDYKDQENDQNILSSLIDKQSVCAGYAKGYQYLLEKVGVSSTYMSGKAFEDKDKEDSEGHAWLMISLDGDYYYSDPTWADVVDKDMKHICYGYFMMSNDEMLKKYIPDSSYELTQNKDIYYKDNGTYMETYQKSIMSQAILKGKKNKSYVAEIKCANESVYKEAKRKLEKTSLGYDVLNANGCYKKGAMYSCDDQLWLIEFYY